MSRSRAILVSMLLFVGLFAVYVLSPARPSGDTCWALYTSVSLASGKGGGLTEYTPLTAGHYAILKIDDRSYNLFPVGVSVLSLPIVAAYSAYNPRFKEDIRHAIPVEFEKLLASFYGALAALLFSGSSTADLNPYLLHSPRH